MEQGSVLRGQLLAPSSMGIVFFMGEKPLLIQVWHLEQLPGLPIPPQQAYACSGKSAELEVTSCFI